MPRLLIKITTARRSYDFNIDYDENEVKDRIETNIDLTQFEPVNQINDTQSSPQEPILNSDSSDDNIYNITDVITILETMNRNLRAANESITQANQESKHNMQDGESKQVDNMEAKHDIQASEVKHDMQTSESKHDMQTSESKHDMQTSEFKHDMQSESKQTNPEVQDMLMPEMARYGGIPNRPLLTDAWRARLYLPPPELCSREKLYFRRLTTYFLQIMDIWLKLLMNCRDAATVEIAKFYDLLFLRYQLKMPLVITEQQYNRLLQVLTIPIDDEFESLTEIRTKLSTIIQKIRSRRLMRLVSCWDDPECNCTACGTY